MKEIRLSSYDINVLSGALNKYYYDLLENSMETELLKTTECLKYLIKPIAKKQDVNYYITIGS